MLKKVSAKEYLLQEKGTLKKTNNGVVLKVFNCIKRCVFGKMSYKVL